MAKMIEAVLLAGGVNKGKLAECSDAAWEAMIDINGRPMASYVVKGILDSDRVSKVIVSGPEELAVPLAQFGERAKLVKPGANLLDSLLNALEATEADRVVIGTADIPLVDGAAIRDMIELCDKQDAEVYYALVFKEDYEKAYPGGKRTYVNLKDGVLTGANVFIASKAALMGKKELISEMYAKRKNPLAMAVALGLGPVTLLRLMTGKVAISEIEAIARKSFKLEGRGIRTRYASIAMDVDKPSDLELARKNARWE